MESEHTWAAVDNYAEKNLPEQEDDKLRSFLGRASQLARDNALPAAEVSPLQGKFLATQCQLIDAKNVLEVGTLGAYSTIWLATSSPGVRVTTIEIDQRHADVARRVIADAKLQDSIELRVGAAADILPCLRHEVGSGERAPFDLVFIDADKQNNLKYFDEAVQMCRPKACIIVDNVVRGGAVIDPEAAERDGRVRGTREVIEAAGRDARILSATLIQTVGVKGYDGFMMAVVL